MMLRYSDLLRIITSSKNNRGGTAGRLYDFLGAEISDKLIRNAHTERAKKAAAMVPYWKKRLRKKTETVSA